MNGTFTCLGPKQNLTEEILGRFSDDIILDVLEDINSRMTYAPPLTVSLLQRLSRNTVTDSAGRTSSNALSEKGHDQLGDKLRIILREDERDEFVPSTYQKTLRAITSSDGISIPELEDVEELRQTLLSHSVETHVCRIILVIMREPPEECPPEALEQNLLELVDYFLEMGDFSFLARIYDQLDDVESGGGHIFRSCSPELLRSFTGVGFIEKILNCLNSWGKEKHPEIRNLICRIGSPFIEPLLERLAEEQNMSLRRSYIDCLMDQGDKFLEAVISRLGDKRWYFVRNLVVILRELDDPSVLKYIRRLCNDPHPKIRREVIRTFQHFSHPEADRFLIQDMNSSDRELQFNAIRLAEKSRSPEAFKGFLHY